MRIHHLNCGCMCPVGGRLWDGASRGLTARLVCHCLLVETDRGLILVDTGFGSRDVERPYERVSPLFIHANRIRFDRRHTALEQVKRRGFSSRDVRHIILTHLDFDHAGGLEDFPNARVHVMDIERKAAEEMRRGFIAKRRYRPDQWNGIRDWRTYDAPRGEKWLGFDAVRSLDGLPPEILMVPLPGHTLGHAGIAVDTGSGWVLNAGDAYFYRRELDSDRRRCTPGLRFYQRLMDTNRELRFANQERLRELKRDHGKNVTIFCSHDEKELEALQNGRVYGRELDASATSRGEAAFAH